MQEKERALHSAIMRGEYAVAKKLLKEDQVDPSCVDENTGDTPLHLAVRALHTRLVFLLLQKGANPFIKNALLHCPYQEMPWVLLTAEPGIFPVALLLMSCVFRKSDEPIPQADIDLAFALFMAYPNAHKGEQILLDLLNADLLNIASTSSKGTTLLHLACCKGWNRLTKALLKAGVDKDAKEGEGAEAVTPLIRAIESKSAECVFLLDAYGALLPKRSVLILEHAIVRRSGKRIFLSSMMPLLTMAGETDPERQEHIRRFVFFDVPENAFEGILQEKKIMLPENVTPKEAFNWLLGYYVLITHIAPEAGLARFLERLPQELVIQCLSPCFGSYGIALSLESGAYLKIALGILAVRQEASPGTEGSVVLNFRPERFLTLMARQLQKSDQSLSLGTKLVRDIWEQKNITPLDPLDAKRQHCITHLGEVIGPYTELVRTEKTVRHAIKKAISDTFIRTATAQGVTRDASEDALTQVFTNIQAFLEQRSR